jgi:hypothetical protein
MRLAYWFAAVMIWFVVITAVLAIIGSCIGLWYMAIDEVL